MTQQRLNHCMVFHIDQERTGALILNSIAKEFAQENERQIALFQKWNTFSCVKVTTAYLMLCVLHLQLVDHAHF